MFFNSNPFDEDLSKLESKLTSENLKAKLSQKYKPKPYHVRTNSTKNTAIAVSYISNIVSFSTGAIALTLIFKSLLSQVLPAEYSTVCSTVLSCLILAGLEKTKREITNNFYQALLQYNKLNKAGLTTKIIILLLSATISTIGADHAPRAINSTQLLQAKIINIDSIKHTFGPKIKQAEATARTYFESNKKPNKYGGFRLSSTLMGTYNNLLAEGKQVRLLEQKAIQEAKAENKEQAIKTEALNAKLTAENKNDNSMLATYLIMLVLTFELIFEACAVYINSWELKALKYFSQGAIYPTEDRGPRFAGPRSSIEKIEDHQVPTQAPFINIDGYQDPIFTEKRINQFIDSYKSKLNDWEQRKAKGRTASDKSRNTILGNIKKWDSYKEQLLHQKQNIA